MSKYTIGLDYGTLSARAVIVDVKTGEEKATSVCEYKHGVIDDVFINGEKLPVDFALQHPADYIEVLKSTVCDIMEKSKVDPCDVIGIGVDFTASTILPVYKDGTPLCFDEKYMERPHAYVKLWKHHAAQEQADLINDAAKNEVFLKRYGGKVSSEWMLPKIMEILEKDEEIYEKCDYFVEAGDWIIWQLTGKMTRSSCMAGYKALWSKEDGYPTDEFLEKLDKRLTGLFRTKLSGEIITTGDFTGYLSNEAAKMLGLDKNTAVAAAIIDAHAALPSLGIVDSGKMLMIMGTSTCHIVMDEKESFVQGISGVVKDGIIKDLYAYEAGQAAVGDIFDWYVKNAVPKSCYDECEKQGVNIHKYLREKAKKLPVGQSGIVALDWWNGNRSLLSNSELSGTIAGLTLTTGPEEIYRALLEATAFGARTIINAYKENGLKIEKLYAAGGIAVKDELFMQIYADVLNTEIFVSKNAQSPALGSAIFASVAGEYYDDMKTAAQKMVNIETISYKPIKENVKKYDELFKIYKKLHDYFGKENPEIMKTLKKGMI